MEDSSTPPSGNQQAPPPDAPKPSAGGKTILVSRRIATPGSYVELRGELYQVSVSGTVEVPADITADEEKLLTEK